MNGTPMIPWIHIGECPVCVNGLCRVRACNDGGAPHLYAMCDECEATWTSPDTASKMTFPQAEHPQCPICTAPLFGEHAHWAFPEDLAGTTWAENAIFEFPTDSIEPNPAQDFLTPDDVVNAIDAPPIAPPVEPSAADAEKRSQDEASNFEVEPLEGFGAACDSETSGAPPAGDSVFGLDEPKPGC